MDEECAIVPEKYHSFASVNQVALTALIGKDKVVWENRSYIGPLKHRLHQVEDSYDINLVNSLMFNPLSWDEHTNIIPS